MKKKVDAQAKKLAANAKILASISAARLTFPMLQPPITVDLSKALDREQARLLRDEIGSEFRITFPLGLADLWDDPGRASAVPPTNEPHAALSSERWPVPVPCLIDFDGEARVGDQSELDEEE